MRNGISFDVSPDDRRRLEALVRDRNTPQNHVWRARIILLTDDGLGTVAVMRETGKSKTCVWRWQERFMAEGVDGLLRDRTRLPGKARVPADRAAEIVRLTQAPPPHEATHWTARAMAKAAGLAVSTVQKIWKAHGLAPHRWRTFKLSKDPAFAEKLVDIVGLYVDPPAHAVVLCVDEMSQMQALDRSQPLLPMRPGQAERHTHDYKRHGTSSLFAALMTKTGVVIGECHRRHRHQEFIKFLNTINRVVQETEPDDREIHLILDNYATHKTPAVQRWLKRHPRYHFHFTPTSASWLNQIERVFADLTQKQLRRGIFRSVAALERAARDYLAARNENAKPFVWKADADTILRRVARQRKLAASTKSGQ